MVIFVCMMLLCENKFNPLPKTNIAFAKIAWNFF